MKLRPLAALLAIGLATAGCISLAKQSPPIHRYMLDLTPPKRTAPAADAPVLAVTHLEPAPACAGKEFVYRTGEFAFEKDFYNQWLEEPATAVTLATQGWLAESGLFGHVLTQGAGVQAQYVLKGEVLAFCGDYRQTQEPKAVVSLRFLLLQGGGPQARIVLQRTYDETAPAGDGSPAALAGGLSKALTQALQALTQDISQKLSGGA